MNNVNSWSSEFRKKKFYERQKKNNIQEKNIILKETLDTIINKPKNIPILLDLDSICNFINDTA